MLIQLSPLLRALGKRGRAHLQERHRPALVAARRESLGREAERLGAGRVDHLAAALAGADQVETASQRVGRARVVPLGKAALGVGELAPDDADEQAEPLLRRLAIAEQARDGRRELGVRDGDRSDRALDVQRSAGAGRRASRERSRKRQGESERRRAQANHG